MRRVKNIFMNKRNIVVALVLFLAIGFAAVTTTLVINGTGIFGTNTDDFDVYFSKAILDGVENNTLISQDGKSITYETANLEIVGDESVLEYTITNNSTQYDAEVSINCELETNDYVRVDNSLEDELIEAKSEGKGTLTAHLFKTSVDERTLTVTCNIIASATEREEAGSEVVNPDEINTYSAYGELVDEEGKAVSEETIVMYSNPVYGTTDNEGYFYLSGIEKGSHTIYLMGIKSIEDLKEMNESEIAAEAISKAEITTNTVSIAFENGYKLINFEIGKTEEVEVTINYNDEERESLVKTLAKGMKYSELEVLERSGYAFLGWYDEEGNEYNQNTKVTNSLDHEITAKWDKLVITEKIYLNEDLVEEYPSSDYSLFESVSCENGTEVTWDESNWKVEYPEFAKDTCIVKFNSLATDFITELSKKNTTTMNTSDPDKNPRYMGANPNNYLSFNGETWRIIGVFEVENSDTGKVEPRLKIIRESIGNYSWDSSELTVNEGKGVNEWSQADIQNVLNGAYLNMTTGVCYSDYNLTLANPQCDFTTIGLTSDSQSLIGNIVWNLGTTINDWNTLPDTETAAQMYSFERSSNSSKICTSSSAACTDTVIRKTTWEGKVGLMYPSDYGYSTSGGTTTTRNACLNAALNSWGTSGMEDCINNSWIYSSELDQWTLTPIPRSTAGYGVYNVGTSGSLVNGSVRHVSAIRPVVYLNTNVKITSGNGTTGSLYQIAL